MFENKRGFKEAKSIMVFVVVTSVFISEYLISLRIVHSFLLHSWLQRKQDKYKFPFLYSFWQVCKIFVMTECHCLNVLWIAQMLTLFSKGVFILCDALASWIRPNANITLHKFIKICNIWPESELLNDKTMFSYIFAWHLAQQNLYFLLKLWGINAMKILKSKSTTKYFTDYLGFLKKRINFIFSRNWSTNSFWYKNIFSCV